MTGCKYFDCGFCYAPLGVENNAHTGECNEPLFCPYLISKMTEKEKIEGEIKILQKKLSFLEELEKTKSPYEEGYKKVFGYYPVTDIGDAYWEYFQKGYEQAQKDYKVGEYQEPEKEPVSLYKRFVDESAYGQLYYDDAIKVVKEFLMEEAVLEKEDYESVTLKLQKSLLEVPND